MRPANVYRLGLKELNSLRYDPVMVFLIIYAFTFAHAVAKAGGLFDGRAADHRRLRGCEVLLEFGRGRRADRSFERSVRAGRGRTRLDLAVTQEPTAPAARISSPRTNAARMIAVIGQMDITMLAVMADV